MNLTFGSVCSGIEAASVAFNPLGWHAVWLSEIEPFPCAVLKYRYPNIPNLGDMFTVAEKILNREVVAPDVLVGGTPCPAFSVAGSRNSLSDERGLLTLEFINIANAIDKVRIEDGKEPCIIMWENVPGVLNTKDNAFGCFIAGISGENQELQPPREKWSNAGIVLGPQRQVAWRTLNAQFFGVPQRRRRIFLVASARNRFNPSKILFESESLSRDASESQKTRETVTAVIEGGFGGFNISKQAGTLKAWGGNLGPGSETLIINSIKKQVRRLTPIECERLQGFPDNWTKIPCRNKPLEDCPDGPRYKAIGNSWAVPVVRWIGERIDAVMIK